MPYFRALFMCHLAVFFMGLAGVFAEAAGFDPWRTTSYRVTLGGIVLGILLLARKPQNLPKPRIIALFLFLGLILGLHWFAFFKSLALLGVILGSAMIGLEPLIIGIVAAVLLKEGFSPRMKISVCISLVGFFILGWGNVDNDMLWHGVGWSIFAFVLFALLVVANRTWVRSESPIMLTFLQMLGAMPLTIYMTPGAWLPASQSDLVYALILGILCTGLAHSLYNASMQVLSAPLVGLLLSLEVVYGLLGGWVIGDRISTREIIAVCFIANILVFDIFGFVRSKLKSKSSPKPASASL